MKMMRMSPFRKAIVVVIFAFSFNGGLANRVLPEKVLVGYASHCSDGSVREAVENGVNVVIWSFVNVAPSINEESFPVRSSLRRNLVWSRNELDVPSIHSNLDVHCVQNQIQQLDADGFDDVVHLVSFGGWNGGHLDAAYTSEQIYESWKAFGGNVFHGLDWDLEGNDDVKSPHNFFTIDCLERMGRISQLAKEDGYIVSMAPPQSYLDLSTTQFSRYVNSTHPDPSWHPDFSYLGTNVYSYILAKYGDYIDMVSVQFYESYSRAAYSILHLGVRPSTYLESYVTDLALRKQSFWVNFEQDPDISLKSQLVHLPLSKLVIGLANGWANGDRTLYIDPSDVKKAYQALQHSGYTPRGFMFWTIDAEGRNGVDFAQGLNEVLHIR